MKKSLIGLAAVLAIASASAQTTPDQRKPIENTGSVGAAASAAGHSVASGARKAGSAVKRGAKKTAAVARKGTSKAGDAMRSTGGAIERKVNPASAPSK